MGGMVLIGVLLAAISGALIFYSDPSSYLGKPKFLAKCVIFSVVVFNGVVLHRFMMPRLLSIAFDSSPRTAKEFQVRRLAFVFGAVSVVSWYSAFFLGFVKDTVFSALEILLAYGGLVAVAILVSLGVERFLQRMGESSG